MDIKSVSQQNPHSTSVDRENNLEIAIGRQVREYRHQMNITVTELSKLTGISNGMLSKIENGNTSPSLTSLQTLANTLSVPLTSFFKGYEERRICVHTPAGSALIVEGQGTRAGHQYNLLGHIGSNDSGVIVEPYIITLTSDSDQFQAFQHNGIETIYMLEGAVTYKHGENSYDLRPGDTLFFDADAPHGPVELLELPAKYISIISYPQQK